MQVFVDMIRLYLKSRPEKSSEATEQASDLEVKMQRYIEIKPQHAARILTLLAGWRVFLAA